MLKLKFETSVTHTKNLPTAYAPEVAFAGRSNAGKSSAINTLAGHTGLAYVSRTPGRTQLINIFRLDNGAALVDLPGYGYAKVPEKISSRWRGLLETYLQQRSCLVGLFLILDCRRPFTDLDQQMLRWFALTGRPVHCLLTKADKLSRQEQNHNLGQAQRTAWQLAEERVSLQLFSSLKKTGIEEACAMIAHWLQSG